MTPWHHWQNHQPHPWIYNTPNTHLTHLIQTAKIPQTHPILLTNPTPIQFLAQFLAITRHPTPLILCNPQWQTHEQQQLHHLIKTATQTTTLKPQNKHTTPNIPNNTILIPTGGTSGTLKFAIHTWDTLQASVLGLQTAWNLSQINSLCLLPLHHVSGLMQALRALISGGTIAPYPWQTLAQGHLPNIDPQDYFLSLVPTQLQRLLDLNSPDLTHFLQNFRAIFLGGAPAWPELLDRARSLHLPLAPTYGMTETAAQIATLHPRDFLAGHSGCGQPLPHAQITLSPTGQIQIQSQSLMLGYFPPSPQPTHPFIPDDLGHFDDRGSLHILGRTSDKIITGGENVHPAELETHLRATHLLTDLAILGIPDRHWGQAIVVAYSPPDAPLEQLQQALTPLSRYKHPKHWIPLDRLPRNPQGKLQRPQLLEQIMNQLADGNLQTNPPSPK